MGLGAVQLLICSTEEVLLFAAQVYYFVTDQHLTAVGMMKVVKAFIQVVGLQDQPSAPAGGLDDLRPWYKKVSDSVV